MRTGMFKVGVGTSWFLLLGPLLVSGCSHRAGQCQPCGSPESGAVGAPQAAGPSVAPTAASAGYGGQTTCPVSGAVLGRTGPAVAVNVKGQTIYVCCQGCAAKVQAAPD